LHQIKEKGVGETGKQKQSTTLPVVKARTLKSQFTFARASQLLDWPAPGIDKDQGSPIIDAGDRFGSQQMPGWQIMIATANH
jgi:hypothetical protein